MLNVIEVKCEFDGTVWCLPLLEETELFREWCDVKKGSREWKLMLIYQAIEKVENYYQFNSPTAFGNPDHRYDEGVLVGLLQGFDWVLTDDKNGWINITAGRELALWVQRPKKPETYRNELKDIRETLSAFGL